MKNSFQKREGIILGIAISICLCLQSCETALQPKQPALPSNGIRNLFDKSGDFNVYANFIAYTSESHYLANGSEMPVTETVSQADFFNENSYGAVDAGEVRFNNATLHKRAHDISPNGYSYEYKNSSLLQEPIPLAFNGNGNTWTVAGGENFPAVSDSLRSPYYRVALSTPAFNATYSRSSGIPLQWNVGQNPSDSVYIRVTGTGSAVKVVANTGSAFFSPNELSTVATGVVSVALFDGNALFKTLSTGKIAFFAIYSSYSVDINLIQ